jgi:hypothetical protein
MGSNKYLKKHKIVTVEIPIVNPHGSLDEIPSDGVYEKQELVISTKDLSIENWKKTRVYASVSEFFYFNKVMQIPILFLNKLLGLSFKKIFEDLMDAKNDNKYKILKKIIEYFYHHAENITKGNSEFCYHKDWLKIYWPPGEYEYIKILKQGNFDILYEELGKFLSEYLINKNKDYKKIFEECLMLNKHLMRRPFERENVNIKTDFNIIECYNLIKQNLPYEIVQKNSNNLIIKNDFFYDNWDDWMREVIWYGHRSGKYICKIETNSKNDAIKHNIVDSNIIGNSYIV